MIATTAVRLPGLDPKRLTFRFQGRDFRFSDDHGELLTKRTREGVRGRPSYARISFTTRPSPVGPMRRWSRPWKR